MSKIYQAEIKNTGGRSGEVSSPDNSFYFKVASPGVKVENATNPEQLFAAGYSACFNGALEVVMQKHNNVHPSTVTAKVSLYSNEVKGFYIDVVLEVHIEGTTNEEAMILVQEADQVCPYSKALRNNVKVELKVV